MYNNNIWSIPDSLFLNAKNLKYLDASFNKLKSFDGITKAQSLEHLNMRGNNLEQIGVLVQFKSLKHINLSDNKLTSIKRR
ncbi:leucine-rich repeat domain-containing protein [Candidatus Cytomitobacter indipagum]|uniref:Leucine-rich repeat domain-containing protein n=1 Tax=Candidatus Cytomitobacter indipagum TaxID=2601575 RepID=A0A5C0UF22_9PROT|nr:leucine-rich repeat domain-containing protein [Candidatus Cytomitobacter indipagum]